MPSRPTNVTEMRALRPSPASTASTTSRTVRSGSARGRPPTLTSLTRGDFTTRTEDPGRGRRPRRVLDPLVEVPTENAGEFLTHALEIAQRERRVVELP